MPKTKAVTIYQLKITLNDIRPPIWRRVLVPGSMTLADLHKTIQLAIGCFNSHLHEFIVDGQSFGDPQWDEFGEMGDERKVTLGELAPAKGRRFTYVYDFGDDWRHLVEVEDAIAYAADAFYPTCLRARRACPPEDVGGPWGYAELLEALASDEPNEEYAELLDWVEEDFDPEAVSVDEINQRFKKAFGT